MQLKYVQPAKPEINDQFETISSYFNNTNLITNSLSSVKNLRTFNTHHIRVKTKNRVPS